MAEAAPRVGTNETYVEGEVQGETIEDEEEEQVEYVLLDLGLRPSSFPPSGCITISGLDGVTPVLTMPDGLRLVGQYEETAGSIMLLDSTRRDPPGGLQGASAGGAAEHASEFAEQRRQQQEREEEAVQVHLRGCTRQRLRFTVACEDEDS